MLVAGRISDILGRKKTFLTGTTIFLLGNLVASFMPNLIGLATMQGVAGVGASIMVPGGLGIIGAQVPVGRPQGYAFAAFSAGEVDLRPTNRTGAPLGAGLGGIISGAVISAGQVTATVFSDANLSDSAGERSTVSWQVWLGSQRFWESSLFPWITASRKTEESTGSVQHSSHSHCF